MMTPHRRYLLAGLGLCLLAAALLAASLNSRTTVYVELDGRTQLLTTRATTVSEALSAAGIVLDPADRVRPPLEAALEPGGTIAIVRAPLVSVDVGADVRLLRAAHWSVPDLLGALGLSLGPGDAAWLDGVPADAPAARLGYPPRHLSVLRAVSLTINEPGGEPRTARVAGATLGEALWDLGYRLYLEDSVQPPLDTPLTAALNVTLQRSRPVLVQADGQALLTRTLHESVGEALLDAGVVLVGEDYSLPAEHEPIPDSGIITVVRVSEEILTEQELIPYQTIYQPLPEVEIDNVYQVQAGVPGVLRQLTRVRYENGVEVSRETEAETLAQPPVDQVIGYGTNIVIRTMDTPDGPIEYWRAYTMHATSYAARFLSRPPDSPNYGRTASGKILTKGLVAIDRTMMPFGTRMYVPGYGFAEAADTGGGVRGRFIDLGYDDWNYMRWSRVVTVYFLTPVPPANAIRWIIPSTVP
jgi:resuscitation-promoting factor RpfB